MHLRTHVLDDIDTTGLVQLTQGIANHGSMECKLKKSLSVVESI